ncbi:hypothetical protein M422DRAFT_267220 [Sphaerobolus stellatus SS14]|uniref:cystathionine gamma-lyase n=1 Tax=Sphaerobolus stellatus (strain SS14) TaxID=990650 RepID=A0A0C9UQ26_SPHS4|nr:hypothetical protein M422DRAFT_267220 [Sphaerobolus stellatus SS14]
MLPSAASTPSSTLVTVSSLLASSILGLERESRRIGSHFAGLETYGGQALVFASGSTTTATIMQALGTGTHVLSINDAYGGTFRYMSKVASQLQGLETTFVDFDSATLDQTHGFGLLHIPIVTPTNPTLRLPNRTHNSLIQSLPAASRPLIAINSTFLSPFYVSPLTVPISAVLFVHSITKYINGHSDVLMGAFILPNASTAQANDNKETIDALYTRLNTDGAIKLARFLLAHPIVKEVIYPGLAEHPGHNNAAKILAPHARKSVDEWVLADEAKEGNERKGKDDFPFGGWSCLGLEGLFTLVESLGGVESLAELPEKMTHGMSVLLYYAELHELIICYLQSIPPAERLALGITPNLVRLSVGVEDVDDLIADVEQALSWAINGWDSATTSVASGDSE